MWNLKRSDTNELANRNRLTDLENELMVARGWGDDEGEGRVREFGIDMYTLLH